MYRKNDWQQFRTTMISYCRFLGRPLTVSPRDTGVGRRTCRRVGEELMPLTCHKKRPRMSVHEVPNLKVGWVTDIPDCLSVTLHPFVGPWPLFQFLDLFTKSVGLLGRVISPSQGRYLHTEQHKLNKRTQTSMLWFGSEPTIPVFERATEGSCLRRCGHCDRHSGMRCSRYSSATTVEHCQWNRFWPPNPIVTYSPLMVIFHLIRR
jgi:hypothetical protein